MDARGEAPNLRDLNSTTVQSALGITWIQMQKLKVGYFTSLPNQVNLCRRMQKIFDRVTSELACGRM